MFRGGGGLRGSSLGAPELGQWLTQPCYIKKGPDWMLEGLVFNTALLLSHQVILGTKLHFFGSQLLPLFIHPLIQFFFPLPIIYLLVTSSLTP